MDLVLFYVPCPSAAVAQALVRSLVLVRLIACGNVVAADSVYMWSGTIAEESEWVAVMKTTEALADLVSASIAEHHPYSVPCIGRIVMTVNAEYGAWVANQCGDEA
jgi:periplasmic divalent cation tolerance protein